ncbi:unnamed protein product [Orchesella dallaii]|uniref:BTB domain-containing protein n=1 Tax=Orchesella dallaii TaxID=48710 RepID=A0ABP1QKI2_9HEXA
MRKFELKKMASNTTAPLYRLQYKESPPFLSSSFAQFFKENLFTDLAIIRDGQTIHCHRMVLAASSPVFENILKTCDAIGTANFFNSINFSHLGNIFQFIYNRKVDLRLDDMEDFLRVGKALKVKGLTDYSESEAVTYSSSGYVVKSEVNDAPSNNKNLRTSGASTAPKILPHNNYRHVKMSTYVNGKNLNHKKIEPRTERERVHRYTTYTKENMEAATRAVSNGIPGPAAARENGIPVSTLYQHLKTIGLKPTF